MGVMETYIGLTGASMIVAYPVPDMMGYPPVGLLSVTRNLSLGSLSTS